MMPHSPWDEPAVRRVLNWAAELHQTLGRNADKIGETADLIRKARQQAAPHPVAFNEVRLHDGCAGAGCRQCRSSGVQHESGQPFVIQTPPATSRWQAVDSPPSRPELAAMRGKLEEARAAQARMQALAKGFDELAATLHDAAAVAKQLASDLRVICGGKR